MKSPAVLTDKVIWILEDDSGARFVYEEILGHRHAIRFFENLQDFATALESSGSQKIDLIIADLRLPDGNFLTYLAESSHRRLLDISFMIVSSLDDVDVLRFCFEEGAIDYLVKPFKKAELLVKVERGFNCRPFANPPIHKIRDVDQVRSELTLKERDLFDIMLAAKGQPVSRSDLMAKVWGKYQVHPKTLDVHLYNIRRKLLSYGLEIESVSPSKWKLQATG